MKLKSVMFTNRLLFGGDQLTAARARGAQRIRSNSERPLDRLEGLEGVCEDWHAKATRLANYPIVRVIVNVDN